MSEISRGLPVTCKHLRMMRMLCLSQTKSNQPPETVARLMKPIRTFATALEKTSTAGLNKKSFLTLTQLLKSTARLKKPRRAVCLTPIWHACCRRSTGPIATARLKCTKQPVPLPNGCLKNACKKCARDRAASCCSWLAAAALESPAPRPC